MADARIDGDGPTRIRPADEGLLGSVGEVSFGEPGLVQKKLRLLMELRRAGIGDARVLGAVEKTPRATFSGTRAPTLATWKSWLNVCGSFLPLPPWFSGWDGVLMRFLFSRGR